jgi:hypothetical protein
VRVIAALYSAACILVFVGIAHSYLGERYLLSRLSRHGDLPKVFRNPVFVFRVMRLAWHITSIAWLGFAALLVLIAHRPVTSEGIGTVIGIVFLLHSAASLIFARGKHLSWLLFLAVGALVIYAVRT